MTQKSSEVAIQRNLDRFLKYYNHDRSNQGYRLKGRTPAQALREALGIAELPPIVRAEEDATIPAAWDSRGGPGVGGVTPLELRAS